MARYGLTHGQTRRGRISREWVAWRSMMTRCYSPKCAMAKHYSERGIAVAPEWHDSSVFLQDMGKKPSPKHTLGRIDGDLGYSKQNCRWETLEQQNRNRRSNVLDENIVAQIRKLYDLGISMREIGRRLGTGHESIRKVIHDLTWKGVGYRDV